MRQESVVSRRLCNFTQAWYQGWIFVNFFLKAKHKTFFFEISWALHFLTGVKSKVKDTKKPSLFIRICATLYLLMGFMGKKTNQYLWEKKLIEIFFKR